MNNYQDMSAFLYDQFSDDELIGLSMMVKQGESALSSSLSSTQLAGREMLKEPYTLLDKILRSLGRVFGYAPNLAEWSDDAPFQAMAQVITGLEGTKWYLKRHSELRI